MKITVSLMGLNGMTLNVYFKQLSLVKASFAHKDLATRIWLYPEIASISHLKRKPPKAYPTVPSQQGMDIATTLVMAFNVI